ncbi:MAG: LamG domain-containing protein [Candidatus Poribacteria bacterium]|nr:LamG domain-containing protein [Candidatus Poribacteria bacterium]
MKILMNVLMLSVVIVGLCGITDAEDIVTDGLVSYWTFDREDIIGNTVKDVWGENNATIVGTPTIVNGHLKDALKFDGIKDYVNLTTLGDFGAKLGFSTVEVWIKTNYKETWTTIFKTIGTGCNNSGHMIWGIDINRKTADLEDIKKDPFGPQIMFTEDFILLYVASFFKNKGGCSLSFLRGEFPISDGEWHHLVYTNKLVDENGTEWKERALFIDGTLNRISEFIPIGPKAQYKYVPFSEPVYLGAGNNRGRAEGFFNGIIDEVRLYDRPLTEAEIMRNYQSTTGLAVDRTDKLPTVWGALKKK